MILVYSHSVVCFCWQGGFTKYTQDLLDALDTVARNITDNGSKLVTGVSLP